METANDQVKLDKYVSREVRIIIMVVAFLSSFYGMVLVPLQSMRNDIDYIKGNHLKHIEDDIAEIRLAEKSETEKNADRDQRLIKIITMLEEREKQVQK